jgi:hypothetical protein
MSPQSMKAFETALESKKPLTRARSSESHERQQQHELKGTTRKRNSAEKHDATKQ